MEGVECDAVTVTLWRWTMACDEQGGMVRSVCYWDEDVGEDIARQTRG